MFRNEGTLKLVLGSLFGFSELHVLLEVSFFRAFLFWMARGVCAHFELVALAAAFSRAILYQICPSTFPFWPLDASGKEVLSKNGNCRSILGQIAMIGWLVSPSMGNNWLLPCATLCGCWHFYLVLRVGAILALSQFLVGRAQEMSR